MPLALLQAEKEIRSFFTGHTNDGAKVFWNQLREMPVLSRAEEVFLFQRLEADPLDAAAKETIILCNLKLIFFVVKKIRTVCPSRWEFQDMFQEGVLGLYRAINQFNWRRGYKFSTYAVKTIYNRIIRAMVKTGFVIVLPIHIQEEISRFARAEKRLAVEKGREPTLEEIAGDLGITVSRIRDLKIAIDIRNTFSLDAPLRGEFNEEGVSYSLCDVLPDQNSGAEEILENSISSFAKEAVLAAVALINDERLEKVIKLRFGLDGGKPHTLEEVGKELNVTMERARQLEKKAICKIRENPRAREILEDFQ